MRSLSPITLAAACASVALVDASVIEGRIAGVEAPQNVVVYIEEPVPRADREDEEKSREMIFHIDQMGRKFIPFVLAIPKGAQVVFLNNDDTVHNIHAKMSKRTVFNIGMPPEGQPIPRRFNDDGEIRLGCDRHLTMEAWIRVIPHRFFAHGDDHGRFHIENVPPGRYTVAAWHPHAERVERRTVDVPPSGRARVDFELSFRD